MTFQKLTKIYKKLHLILFSLLDFLIGPLKTIRLIDIGTMFGIWKELLQKFKWKNMEIVPNEQLGGAI